MPPEIKNKVPQENIADYAARLETVLKTVIDGIITIDSRGTIQSFNPSAERIFGYRPEEVIGRNVKILMPEPYHSEHDGYIKNYLQSGQGKVIGIGREVKALRKDGSVFPMELGINQMNIAGAVMFVGTIRDISDRKQAEDELLRSNEELERFAYIASHDLQEPLRMVANFTALLDGEYRGTMDAQAGEYMDFITDAARRMQEMVGDLLEYSRLGCEDAGFSDVNSESHTKMALANLYDVIEETEASVRIGDLPVIHVNPVRFLRLMQNLIGNAVKYRREDVRPDIRVEVEDRGREWLFSVSDNGIGMKEEYLQQIFIIFKRLHGKKDYQGTGIGLAACKKIVEGFEGKIWAESRPGEGSTFYFTVPKKETARQAA
ncbi:MAG: PAS domain S-box protein [Alphaproteobacteria bacterium]|nr:PAS domain S-box protein [Alphaproteobacteria bacterium]